MVKIKFNLPFRDKQIRTLEELRENFSIEDVLEYYDKGVLARWLDSRGYADELKQVRAIPATDARGVLKELLRIFAVETAEDALQEDLSLFDYLEGRRRFWENLKNSIGEDLDRKSITASTERETGQSLEHYRQDYQNFIDTIAQGPQDLHWIYDRMDQLTADSPQILELSAGELFLDLYVHSPLAAVALFGHSGTRPYFVLSKEDMKRLKETQEGDYTFNLINLLGEISRKFNKTEKPMKPDEKLKLDYFIRNKIKNIRRLCAILQLYRFIGSSSFPKALGEDNYRSVDLSQYAGKGWVNIELDILPRINFEGF